jgi:CheY-like chemotaxis protein
MSGPVLRVLCVDDNQDAADALGLLVTALGHRAEVCYDGPSALEAAGRFRPDVCLLDLNMPVMDGCELAGWLREQAGDRRVTVVAVSGAAPEDVRRRTAAAGFDRHLMKPVGADTISDILTTHDADPQPAGRLTALDALRALWAELTPEERAAAARELFPPAE